VRLSSAKAVASWERHLDALQRDEEWANEHDESSLSPSEMDAFIDTRNLYRSIANHHEVVAMLHEVLERLDRLERAGS